MTTEIEIQEQSTDLAERAMSLTITNLASFEVTHQYVVDLQKMKKEMKEYHKPLKAATHAAHKAATKRENDDLSPLNAADTYIRNIRADYVREEDEKRAKEQAKKDAAAEKKAEKEREKLRKKAEKEEDPEKKQELVDKAEEVYVEPVIVESAIEKSSKVEGRRWIYFC